MTDTLQFVIGQHVLSFGWNEPYETIARRDERLRGVPFEQFARARAVPPDADCLAPADAWDIVVDHVPAWTQRDVVEDRCRRAFASVRPVLPLLMRR